MQTLNALVIVTVLYALINDREPGLISSVLHGFVTDIKISLFHFPHAIDELSSHK